MSFQIKCQSCDSDFEPKMRAGEIQCPVCGALQDDLAEAPTNVRKKSKKPYPPVYRKRGGKSLRVDEDDNLGLISQPNPKKPASDSLEDLEDLSQTHSLSTSGEDTFFVSKEEDSVKPVLPRKKKKEVARIKLKSVPSVPSSELDPPTVAQEPNPEIVEKMSQKPRPPLHHFMTEIQAFLLTLKIYQPRAIFPKVHFDVSYSDWVQPSW